MDTILLIGGLSLLGILGLLIALIGFRGFRIFAVLFALIAGCVGINELCYAFDSSAFEMPFLIIMVAVAIFLAVLAFFFQKAGLGISGLLCGIGIGVGVMFSLDTLLDGAVPPMVYTVACVVIGVAIALVCILKPSVGAIASTSFCGAFLFVGCASLLLLWVLTQGSSVAATSSAIASTTGSPSVLVQLDTLVHTASDKSMVFYYASSIFCGLGFCLIQRRSLAKIEAELSGSEEDAEEAPSLQEEPAHGRGRRGRSALAEEEEAPQALEEEQQKKRRGSRFRRENEDAQAFEESLGLDEPEDEDVIEEAGDEYEQEAPDAQPEHSLRGGAGVAAAASVASFTAQGVDEPTMVFEPVASEHQQQKPAPSQRPVRPAQRAAAGRQPLSKRRSLSDVMEESEKQQQSLSKDYQPSTFTSRSNRRKGR